MARTASPVAFLATAALLALAPLSAGAQRPALAGEKARVADAVKRDLTRLAALQRTHLGRTNVSGRQYSEPCLRIAMRIERSDLLQDIEQFAYAAPGNETDQNVHPIDLAQLGAQLIQQ